MPRQAPALAEIASLQQVPLQRPEMDGLEDVNPEELAVFDLGAVAVGEELPAEADPYTALVVEFQRTGDPDVYGQLTRAYLPELLRVARGYSRNNPRLGAEDLVQDVLMKVWRANQARLAEGAQPFSMRLPLFLNTLRWHARDHATKHRENQTITFDPLEHDENADGIYGGSLRDSTDGWIDRMVALDAIRTIIDDVTSEGRRDPATRALILEMLTGETPYNELAIKYGKTHGAIKALGFRIHRRAKAMHAAGLVRLPKDD